MNRSLLFLFVCSSCATTIPDQRLEKFSFPEVKVYIEEPTGKEKDIPYQTMGWVKARASYPTMEQEPNDNRLCRNYYNKAARSLLKEAQKAGADAVIKVRSVVAFIDGKLEEHISPECSDDGAEGEILLRGIAIKFKPVPKKIRPESSPSPQS